MALIVLFLAFFLSLRGALGELVCEELPIGMCSYAISSAGNRCSLETYATSFGSTEFQCKTSQVMVENIREHIESDECIKACGLDRNSVGISSDTLVDPRFASKICSSPCSDNCPNILHLYHNLALAEGVNLAKLCKILRNSPRRAMAELVSSGVASSGPSTSIVAAEAPCSDSLDLPPFPSPAPAPL